MHWLLDNYIGPIMATLVQLRHQKMNKWVSNLKTMGVHVYKNTVGTGVYGQLITPPWPPPLQSDG